MGLDLQGGFVSWGSGFGGRVVVQWLGSLGTVTPQNPYTSKLRGIDFGIGLAM